MKTIKELLNETKAAKGIETDYALAKALDLHSGLISDYYKGKRHPNEYACLQIAQALNKDIAEILSIVRLSAEKDEKRRAAWAQYYKSIGGIAASVALLLFLSLTLIVTSTPAEASNGKVSETQHFVLCKVEMIKAWIKKVVLTVLNTPAIFARRSCFLG